MIDVVQLCLKVLVRLSAMDYEKDRGISSEQLIFPKKIQEKGASIKNRISEQELRVLFIEEFKTAYPKLFYSIETPTVQKYAFQEFHPDNMVNSNGQSALFDMVIFDRKDGRYERILSIEFKHKNSEISTIKHDILKLTNESHHGAFIMLLDNTNRGTLNNSKRTGVFDKLLVSFSEFQRNWDNENKVIKVIIMSLKQRTLIHRDIKKVDLPHLGDFFLSNSINGNILELKTNGWMNINLDTDQPRIN